MKKKDTRISTKVKNPKPDGRIIVACPKPNKFRRAFRRKLIKSIKAYEAASTSNIAIVGHRPHAAGRVTEYEQRRKILDGLIVKRKTFFYSEIEKDFSDATGGYRCLDPFTSLREVINNLVEVGALDKKMDRYYFSPRTSPRR